MNYVKKMCILRQVKQGFSGDGKALSGLIKVEQYGKNLAVEVSVINFAPLVSGEYYCLLSDGRGKTETLALRGKSLFNILSDLDVSRGFCAVVCYVKNEIVPVAYGVNGNGSYDWRSILNAALPPVFPQNSRENRVDNHVDKHVDNRIENPMDKANESAMAEATEAVKNSVAGDYDDEVVATENYYREAEHGQGVLQEVSGDAHDESGVEKQDEKAGLDSAKNDDAENVLHPFKQGGDGYYRHVKSEIDELFSSYPPDDTLSDAFACSKWVRVQQENGKEYLVGVLYEGGEAQYICYALPAEDKNSPPAEIAEVCSFVPCTVFEGSEGYFVIFQSAATGECVKPESV